MSEKGSCELTYDAKNGWIFADWIGRPEKDVVMTRCMDMLAMLKEHKLAKVLNSNSKVTGSWSTAADWVAEEWFPQMTAAGLKYFAWVQSPSALSNLSAKRSQESQSADDIIHFFASNEEAAKWLNSV